MKKIYVLVIVILSMVSTMNSQEIKIGAKAGLNLASTTGGAEESKSRTAFHIGGMVEIPITTEFYVQPELLFSSQGYKIDSGTGVLNYISIPIMGKYKITEELSLEAGPQIGYLLSAKNNVEDNGGGTNEPLAPNTETGKTAQNKSSNSLVSNAIEQDIKEFFNSTDFTFGIGVGYKLDNGINFSARYNIGLSNISKVSSQNIKSSVFMLSAGYYFL